MRNIAGLTRGKFRSRNYIISSLIHDNNSVGIRVPWWGGSHLPIRFAGASTSSEMEVNAGMAKKNRTKKKEKNGQKEEKENGKKGVGEQGLVSVEVPTLEPASSAITNSIEDDGVEMQKLRIDDNDAIKPPKRRRGRPVKANLDENIVGPVAETEKKKLQTRQDMFSLSNQLQDYDAGKIHQFEASLIGDEETRYVQSLIREVVTSAKPKKPVKKRAPTAKSKLKEKEKEKASCGSGLALANQSLIQIYDNWRLPHEAKLPMSNALFSNQHEVTPFEFYTSHNSDSSIVKSPRLSTTRLLVNSWCQFRDYYSIFAGSPRTETKAMQSGTQHHAQLEIESHPELQMDFTALETFYNCKMEELKADAVDETTLAYLNSMHSIDAESIKSMDWFTQIISRLYVALVRGVAREVLVCGYLDLPNHKFIDAEAFNGAKSMDKLAAHGGCDDGGDRYLEPHILVSGVVDMIKVANPRDACDYTFHRRLNDVVDFEFEKDQDTQTPIIDLGRFINEVQILLNGDFTRDNLSVTVTDVKTRHWSNVPRQRSVLRSAKIQTMYYRYMMQLLSADENFAYQCLVRSARIRGLDVDKPLNHFTILQMLHLHYDLLSPDFAKLKNGQSIGFDPYDRHVVNSHGDSDPATTQAYNFGILFQNSHQFSQESPQCDAYLAEMEPISAQLEFNQARYLRPLLGEWKTPPTLRYFAARAAQFYHLFHGFLGDETTVEYHNAKLARKFHTNVYKYDEAELEEEIEDACKFWNGEMRPKPVDDVDKCRYCDFASKCVVFEKASKSEGKVDSAEAANPEQGRGSRIVLDLAQIGPALREFVKSSQTPSEPHDEESPRS
ncbi:uncharacterized protein LODBEIA_P08100 [Lodderomyces beijingensis]|uniref:Exonuclease V, mitochondrial n=1 Tax=Lodderomyces beijingensis TaxID=1775926 RepID=A0ABP0ZIE4_9ASCO